MELSADSSPSWSGSYWTSFVLLVGAELNAELAKESKKGSLQPKESPPHDNELASRLPRLIAPRSQRLSAVCGA